MCQALFWVLGVTRKNENPSSRGAERLEGGSNVGSLLTQIGVNLQLDRFYE